MNLDFDQQRAAQDEMDAGEKLLWTGGPDPRRALLQALPLAPLGMGCCAGIIVFLRPLFADTWYHHPSGTEQTVYLLVQLFLILMGLLFLSVPYHSYRKAIKTVYAISDRRLLIIRGGASRKVESYEPRGLGETHRTERADGAGNLVIGNNGGCYSGGAGAVPTTTSYIIFYGIPNVRAVEKLVRESANRSQNASTTRVQGR